MRLVRVVAVLVVAVCIGGCSVKLAYNNLDRLIRWQVSDYFDLTREQRDYLNREVDAALRWHRKEHLPQYADFVDTIPARFSDEVTPEMIEALFAQLFLWGDEIEAKAMPAMVQTLVSLDAEQVQELPERFRESNEELAEAESEGTLEEHQAEWAENMRDTLSRFVGRLNDEQKTYIEIRSRRYAPELVLWAAYRKRWQDDLVTLLQNRRAPDFGAKFRRMVERREDYYGEGFARVSRDNEALSRDVAAYVFNTLSEKQRNRFVETLEDLSRDFRELAAQA